MSKRVLIILGIGILLILGAFFLHKKEMSDYYEPEPEPEPELKHRKNKKEVEPITTIENANIQEETTGTPTGTE